MTKKALIFTILLILLASSVTAYTKSADFEKKENENKVTRVGISAGEFAPKQPRFITNITIIKPVIIPLPGIATVSFEEQMRREAAAKAAAKKAEEDAARAEERAQEAREAQASAFAKKAEEARRQLELEKRRNTKEATLRVESSSMKDMRVSPKIGSIISLAIVLVGLLIYLSFKITSLKK